MDIEAGRRVALKPMYYWVAGLDSDTGKLTIAGPKVTEDEAEALASGKGFLEYEIVKLPTVNEARATRMLKAMRLENSTIMEALQRIGHYRESSDEV